MSDITFEGMFASQGWQCPICKRVYSPYTPMCYYCGGEQKTTVNTTNTDSNPVYFPPNNNAIK